MDILKYVAIEVITHYIGEYLNEKLTINNIDINLSMICINNIEIDVDKINNLDIIKNIIELFNIKFKKIFISKIKFNKTCLKEKINSKKIEDFLSNNMIYLNGLYIILEPNNNLESIFINTTDEKIIKNSTCLDNISQMSIDNLTDYNFEKIKNNNSCIFGNDDYILDYISNLITNLIFKINIKIELIKIICEFDYLPIIITIPLIISNNSNKNIPSSLSPSHLNKKLNINTINIYKYVYSKNNNILFNNIINEQKKNYSNINNQFGLDYNQSLINIDYIKINFQLIKNELNENDLNQSSFLDFNNNNINIILLFDIGHVSINLTKFNTTFNTLDKLFKIINNNNNNSYIKNSRIIQNNKLSRIHDKIKNKYNLKQKIKFNSIKIIIEELLLINLNEIIISFTINNFKLFINNIKINVNDNILDKLIDLYFKNKVLINNPNNNSNNNIESQLNKDISSVYFNKLQWLNNNIFKNLKLKIYKLEFILNRYNSNTLINKDLDNINVIINKLEINLNYNNHKLKCYFEINNLLIKDGIKKSKWNKLLCNDVTMKKITENMFIILFDIEFTNTNTLLNLNIHINPLRLFINQYTLFYILSIIQKIQKIINYKQKNNKSKDFPTNKNILTSFKSNKILLQIDYKPVRFNINNIWNNNYIELINIFPIENLNIVLNTININSNNNNNNNNNVWKLCKEQLINDVCKKISYKYLSSIILINSFTNIISSILDIFIISYDEYEQNIDTYNTYNLFTNCIDKITKNSFDIITRLTINLNSALEWGQYIIYPNEYSENIINEKSKFANQPQNIIDGFSQTYNNFIDELKNTGNIIILPFKHNHNILEFPRMMPIIILKPLSTTLYSISKIMLGLKNNLIINDNIKKDILNKYG